MLAFLTEVLIVPAVLLHLEIDCISHTTRSKCFNNVCMSCIYIFTHEEENGTSQQLQLQKKSIFTAI